MKRRNLEKVEQAITGIKARDMKYMFKGAKDQDTLNFITSARN